MHLLHGKVQYQQVSYKHALNNYFIVIQYLQDHL